MSNEIELKLEVAPAATEWLGNWLNAADCRTERQSTIYYDTADSELRRCGYSLRVRSIGARFVQTLKSLDGGAGMFSRGEWEDEIEGPLPDVARLAGTPAGKLKIKELEPIIRSEIDRTVCRVDRSGSELELDIDLGTVSAAAREIPVSEVEIELISGEPCVAVEMAQRIAAEVPVRLGVMSKVERGFALADGKMSAATKSEPVPVRSEMTAAQGFQTIVSACLRHFRLNEPVVAETRDVEALHQVRVAIRRLRSALALFRPAVRDSESKRIQKELRWLIAELGDARNLDVFLERNLPADQRAFIEERRTDAYDRAIAAMDSARSRQLMLDLLAWTFAGNWQAKARAKIPLQRFLKRRIDRIWSKVAKSNHVAALSDAKRHKLRIRVKKLRYGLEFADVLQCGRTHKKTFMKALKQTQELLGSLHDIVTARSLVTLNSWLMGPAPSEQRERRLVRDAGHGFARLREVGPYWT